jgi:hypothetical protein
MRAVVLLSSDLESSDGKGGLTHLRGDSGFDGPPARFQFTVNQDSHLSLPTRLR